MKATPFPWQVPHVEFAKKQLEAWGHVRLLLALDTGLGKTFVAAFICRDVLPSQAVLVAAPLSTLGGWFEKWRAVEPERRIEVVPQGLTVSKRYGFMRGVLRESPDAVLITNHHTLILASPKQLRQLSERVSVGILDEAHVAKNQNTKTARRIVQSFVPPHRMALTATPIEQRPSQLWSLLAWLRPDIYGWGRGKRTFWAFAYTYEKWGDLNTAYGTRRTFQAVRDDRIPVLHKELAKTGVYRRVKKEEVQELPPLQVVPVRVPMTEKQRELYDNLQDELLAIDAGGRVVAVAEGGSLMTRLRQVEEGAFHFGFEDNDNPKLDRLRTILAADDLPVVVFTPFVITTDWLEGRLREDGYKVARITGQETAGEKTQAVKAVNNGAVDVLIATYGAGGEGIDLVGSHTMVAWGLPWSYIKWTQAIDRLHRTGQEHPVKVYVFRSTPMAYVVWNLLQRKENVSEAALTAALKTGKGGL